MWEGGAGWKLGSSGERMNGLQMADGHGRVCKSKGKSQRTSGEENGY